MKRGTKRKSYIRGETISESGLGKLPPPLSRWSDFSYLNDKRARSWESRTLQKEKTPGEDVRWPQKVITQNEIVKNIHACAHACANASTHAGGTGWKAGHKLDGEHWMTPLKVTTRR